MKFFSRKLPEPIVIHPVQQPQDMDEEQQRALRAGAQMEYQTALAMRDRIMTEITTSARWVQTSLLLVNGGAAVAVLQSEALTPHARGLAGAAFVIGMMFSLLSAYTGIQLGQDAPRRFSYIAGYWLGITIDLLRSEEVERDWAEYGRNRVRLSRLSTIPGWLSLIAFIVGCLTVASYLI
jgi:hypothetical protein